MLYSQNCEGRKSLLTLILGSILTISFPASPAAAATYDVGPGQTFTDFQLLVASGVLLSGDTVVIHGDDATANNIILSAANMNLTIRSADGLPKTLSQSVPSVHRGGFIHFTNSTVTSVSVFNITNMFITNNTAQGIDTWPSTGQGGAVATSSNLTLLGSNVKFINNIARAGSGTQSGGQGGAVWASNTLSLAGSDNIEFSGNQAIGGDRNNSGQGGAVYAAAIDLSNVSNLTFSGNQAIGGSNASSVHVSGLGGALAVDSLDLIMDGATNVVFTGNSAIGGSGQPSDSVYSAGLGGAVFLNYSPIGVRTITGSSFLNNTASTQMAGEMSSGRGGAIFNSGANLTLKAQAGGGDILFSGNTHNPGNTGATPNSIYFGNIDTNADVATSFTVDVDAGALVTMLDPMASQEDDLTSLNGTIMKNVSLDLTKTGAGEWILGGHNDMRSATTWNVDQGTLRLEVVDGRSTHIDLSHDQTAVFNLNSGSTLLISPTESPHLITARDISFSGSVGLSDGLNSPSFSYALHQENEQTTILSLLAEDSLTNNSTLLNTGGSFFSGMYEYEYGLSWRENSILSLDLLSLTRRKIYNHQLGASAATTGPSSIAAQNVAGRIIAGRTLFRFDELAGSSYEKNQANSGLTNEQIKPKQQLWAETSYVYSKQNSNSNYNIKNPGISVGIDNYSENKGYFWGTAIYGGFPKYKANYSQLDAQNLSAILYGGAVLPHKYELSWLASYGYNWYNQTRKVFGESYTTKYKGHNWLFGLGIGKRINMGESRSLRPFIEYNYLRSQVNAYSEQPGTYALNFNSQNVDLHFLKTGLEMRWLKKLSDVRVKLYYSGLYGDNKPEVKATFVLDNNQNSYISYGDKLSKHALGMSLEANLNLSDKWDFSANYVLEAGGKNRLHFGTLTFTYNF